MADGGAIGGGIITGEDYGNRTNFAEPKLIIEEVQDNLKACMLLELD